MSYTEDRSAVKRLNQQIKKAVTDTEAWNWERAERVTRMCGERSQREVAKDVDLNQATVSIIVRIWKAHGDYPANQRGSYTDAYNAVPGTNSANFGKEGGRTPKEKAATVIAALADPEALELVRDQLLELLGVTHAPRITTSHVSPNRDTANTAAVGAVADALSSLKRANQAVDPDHLSEHQAASAEVMLRSSEAEIAVWRDRVEGGFSDAAIQAVMAGEA